METSHFQWANLGGRSHALRCTRGVIEQALRIQPFAGLFLVLGGKRVKSMRRR